MPPYIALQADQRTAVGGAQLPILFYGGGFLRDVGIFNQVLEPSGIITAGYSD
jgi:hypothetical protein